ncbi:phosphatase PAP2 family protein [Solirubrobacter phytolaccae]|uniref:Phosphatase PAP2 family protein n=1 Tax=Solirubrobacter phytolaccae TaxID=1404360 RepID=A0A9X3NBB0_9ACTN|nr:phosphatase PAP2 family protein [Solirubrobacter phytolaccae]MDA0181959.1 phosphatase PAP2 family protein [Solirubrobacter phytolaccae]
MRRPLLLALWCAVLFVAAYVGFVHVPALRDADLRVLEGFMGLWSLPGAQFGDDLVLAFDPAPFAAMVLGVVAVAHLLGRTRAGLLAAGAMLAANVSTQILKPLLAIQRDFPLDHFMGPEAYPSGHTTAVMSFALALVIIAPPRWRALVATFAGLLTVLTTFSIMMLGWHYPSDIVGGLLVATFWACLVVIPLRAEVRAPSLRASARAGAVLVGGAALLALTRPAAAVDYALANTTWLLGAVAIAVAALVLSGSVPAPTAARPRPRRDLPHG